MYFNLDTNMPSNFQIYISIVIAWDDSLLDSRKLVSYIFFSKISAEQNILESCME